MQRVRLLVAAFIMMMSAQLQAAVVVPLSLEELTASSDAVVEARVLSCTSRLDQVSGRITTENLVTISRVLKGSLVSSSVVKVLTLGGETSELGQLVPGEAQLRPDEEVLLFLRAAGSDWTVNGMAQGKFSPTPGVPDHFRRDLKGLGFALPRGKTMPEVPAEVNRDRLRALIPQVKP